MQNSQTFKLVCEGGSSCLVEDGSYIVINHTSGERFDNIVVPEFGGDEGATEIAIAEVDGSRIEIQQVGRRLSPLGLLQLFTDGGSLPAQSLFIDLTNVN